MEKLIFVLLSLFCIYVTSSDSGEPSSDYVGSMSAFQKIQFENHSHVDGYYDDSYCYDVTFSTPFNASTHFYFDDVDFAFGASWIDVGVADYLQYGVIGSIEVRLDNANGTVLANITIGPTGMDCEFKTLGTFLSYIPTGIQTVVFSVNKADDFHYSVYLGWFEFKANIDSGDEDNADRGADDGKHK